MTLGLYHICVLLFLIPLAVSFLLKSIGFGTKLVVNGNERANWWISTADVTVHEIETSYNDMNITRVQSEDTNIRKKDLDFFSCLSLRQISHRFSTNLFFLDDFVTRCGVENFDADTPIAELIDNEKVIELLDVIMITQSYDINEAFPSWNGTRLMDELRLSEDDLYDFADYLEIPMPFGLCTRFNYDQTRLFKAKYKEFKEQM